MPSSQFARRLTLRSSRPAERFPFAAEIAEFQERGPLRAGDRVTVEAITDIDDLYGVLVTVKYQRHTYHFPLCDLKVIDQESPDLAQLLQAAVQRPTRPTSACQAAANRWSAGPCGSTAPARALRSGRHDRAAPAHHLSPVSQQLERRPARLKITGMQVGVKDLQGAIVTLIQAIQLVGLLGVTVREEDDPYSVE